MSPLGIRIYGDPVLKTVAAEVTNVDGALARLVDDMVTTLYEANGLALAAPQIGVQKRFFVYDMGDGPEVIINPVIHESDGEWVYDEGCLSIPGLYVEMVRPKLVHVTGIDINGNELSIEADELFARMLQHEIDHLHGNTMFDKMTDDQRREALREWRRMQMEPPAAEKPKRRLRLGS
ncbi:MAG: peptide deformylase [Acidimicrobiia bacterium]|jgi:peptide deformylase